MKNMRVSSCILALLALALAASLVAQRADRAVITGVVADPTGALIPGATVTILDEATGVATALESNAAGAYSSPPLGLGHLYGQGRERRVQEIPKSRDYSSRRADLPAGRGSRTR